MKKIKLTHEALGYVEGHDEDIIENKQKNKRGYDEYVYSIMVVGSMEVCPTCGGHGTHDRRDLDCSRLVDNMYEDGDFDGIENYFNGQYSQICEQCKGKNVVLVPLWESIPEWARKAMTEWDDAERESREEEAAERAMGC